MAITIKQIKSTSNMLLLIYLCFFGNVQSMYSQSDHVVNSDGITKTSMAFNDRVQNTPICMVIDNSAVNAISQTGEYTASSPASPAYTWQGIDFAKDWLPPAGPGVTEIISNAGIAVYGLPTSFLVARVWTPDKDDDPLPISLLNFDAKCNGSYVDITWVTASEINNDYFTIQRSIDAQDFVDITYMPGAGNSNMMLYYSYTDKNPFGGTAYYRLKQTDYDGSSTYSHLVAVENCNADTLVFNTYYSVSEKKVVIQYQGDGSSPFTVSMKNMIGQEVVSETSKKIDQAEINVGALVNGIYLVVVKTQKDVLTTKVYLPR